MQDKNLYHVLGVAETATQAEIRQAYLIRSKMMHPDRFDQQSQRAEWELANEMLKELNHAFGVLRDTTARSQYDERRTSAVSSQAPPTRTSQRTGASARPPREDFGYQSKHGVACFSALPNSVQERLHSRIDRTNREQFLIKLADVRGKYVLAILLTGWPILVFITAKSFARSDFGGLAGITIAVALLQAWVINWILRWHSSSIRCWLIVTPLYVIKTHLDRIRYWGVSEISDVAVTHNYTNGIYQNSSVRLQFGATSEELTVSSKIISEALINTLGAYRQQLALARSSGDWEYFLAHDDFRDAPAPPKPLPRSRVSSRATGVILITLLIHGGFLAAATSSRAPQAPLVRDSDTAKADNPFMEIAAGMSSPPVTSPELPSRDAGAKTSGSSTKASAAGQRKRERRPTYDRPVTAPNGQPWPAYSGYVSGYPFTATNGLSTITIDNSGNSSDVFLKLVLLGSGQATPVRVCYIAARSKFKFETVAPGVYDVRYQDLSTGGLSKTEEFSIMETKTFQGTQFTNLSLTLYKVSNGNMVTQQIDPSEF
jgi:hypothetical protein